VAPAQGQLKPPYDVAVAYDEALAGRIRELIGDDPSVTERKMFGGLAFLVAGHMAVSASGQGGIMIRVNPAEADSLVASTQASVAVMRDRPMPGWLRVASEHLGTEEELGLWVEQGTNYARSLPPKS